MSEFPEHVIPQLNPIQAKQHLASGAVLLDVRTPEERNAGFVPGSTFIPLHELEARHGELDFATEIIVICRAGGRSQAAAEFLGDRGATTANLAGGMHAWVDAGEIIDSTSGAPGVVI